MSTIAELLERVEGATGPDRELDFAIDALVNPIAPSRIDHDVELPPGWGRDALSMAMDPRPHYSASVDAALDLVGRMLGVDSDALCYNYDLGWHASARAQMSHTAHLDLATGTPAVLSSVDGQGPTLPLAILAALLAALLRAQDRRGGE